MRRRCATLGAQFSQVLLRKLPMLGPERNSQGLAEVLGGVGQVAQLRQIPRSQMRQGQKLPIAAHWARLL